MKNFAKDIFILLFLFFFPLQVKGQDISFEVVTPHIKWANPYYQGKIKALILVDSHSGRREIVELAQRLDMEVDTVKFLHTDEYAYIGDPSIGDLSIARTRLKEKLKKDYDVILVSGLNWSEHFDDEIINTIVSKVKEGTGLFLIAPYNLKGELETFASGGRRGAWADVEVVQNNFLTSGIPWELLPKIMQFLYNSNPPEDKVFLKLKDKPMCWFGELGKGKVLVLAMDVYVSPVTPKITRNWAHILPYFLNENTKPVNREGEEITYKYWEFFYSFLAKGMLWLSNKQPFIQIKKANLTDKTFNIVLESEKEEKNLTVELVLRNRFSEDEHKISRFIDVKKGENSLSIPISSDNLFFGLTLFDVFVKNSEKKIINWTSTYVRTEEPLYIKDVVFSETIIGINAPKVAKGTITLEGTVLDAVVPSEYSIEINAYDLYNRQIYKNRKSFNDPTIVFQVAPVDLLTIPIKIEILLKKGNMIQDKKEQTVLFLKERKWDPSEFHLISWYLSPFRGRSGRPYLNNFAYQKVFEYGVNAVYTHSTVDQYYNTIKNNIMFCPYGFFEVEDKKFEEKSKLFKETKDKQYLVREPSFSDPEYIQKVKKAVQEKTKEAMIYGGAHDYVIADEFGLARRYTYYDFDFSQSSIQSFREWLKKQYKTLSNLNKEWETEYKSWDEIMPLTLEEAKTLKNGNYAPWADFRTFMDDTVCQLFSLAQITAQEIDPFAKFSLSGTQSPRAGAGTDWWKLCNTLPFLHSYNVSNTAIMHSSFGKYTGTLFSPYYAANEATMWWSLFYDAYGVSIWMTPRLLDPDLSPSPLGKIIKKSMDDFKSGLWTLIKKSKKEQPKIAVHYSHPSIQAFCVLEKEMAIDGVRNGWADLLHDLGYQFDFVSYAQIEQDDFLSKNGYKILILPQSIAISEKEAREIEKFVSSGGIVIGDANIGLMNNKCRTLKEPYLLRTVFGVEITSSPIKPEEFTLTQDLGNLKKGQTISLVPQHSLISKGATPLLTSQSNKGVFYVNNYGQGKGVFVNLDVSTYVHRRMLPNDLLKYKTNLSNMVKGVLMNSLSLNPPVIIKSTDGKMFEGDVFVYNDQDAKYLGVVGRWYSRTAQTNTYDIILPGTYHIYDLKQHQYLGQSNSINMELVPNEAKLYALCIEKLEPIDAVVEKTSYTPSEKVNFKVLNTKIRKHHTPVYLEVIDPDGKIVKCYSSQYFINPGQQQTQGTFRFAYNDKPGIWKLKFTDLFTGTTTVREVILK